MSEFNAKPTEYDNYLFRSRLEARWAVLFNSLNVKYEYEPQGFNLPNGDSYLPDFYLPDFNCYFEVKHANLIDSEIVKAIEKIRTVAGHTDKAALITFGDPVDDNMYMFCYETDDDGGGDTGIIDVTIGVCPWEKHTPFLFEKGSYKPKTYYADSSFTTEIPMENLCRGKFKDSDFVTNEVNTARIRARQAQFEHGVKPSTRPVWED